MSARFLLCVRSDFTPEDFLSVRDTKHWDNWLSWLIKTYGEYKEYNRNFSSTLAEC